MERRSNGFHFFCAFFYRNVRDFAGRCGHRGTPLFFGMRRGGGKGAGPGGWEGKTRLARPKNKNKNKKMVPKINQMKKKIKERKSEDRESIGRQVSHQIPLDPKPKKKKKEKKRKENGRRGVFILFVFFFAFQYRSESDRKKGEPEDFVFVCLFVCFFFGKTYSHFLLLLLLFFLASRFNDGARV